MQATSTPRQRVDEAQAGFEAMLDVYGAADPLTRRAFDAWQAAAAEALGAVPDSYDVDRFAAMRRRRAEYHPTPIERWIARKARNAPR